MPNRWIKKRLFHAKAGAKGGKRNGIYYRSRWEFCVSLVLDAMKSAGLIHSWGYEKKEFSFPVKRGTRFYKPDFEVVNREGEPPVYWEVKGLMAAKDVTALSRMARYYPEVQVLIVGKKEYAEFESEYGHLEGWER